MNLSKNITPQGQKFDKYFVIGVFLLLLIYIPVLHNFPIGGYVDDGIYISLAKSLANGKGFFRANNPFATPEVQYPPGFPLLLVPFIWLFPDNLSLLRLVSLITTIGTIGIAYILFAKDIKKLAVFIPILLTIHPWIIAHVGMVMSESAYMFFSILAILCYHNYFTNKNKKIFTLFLFICSSWLSFLIRTIGIALIISFPTDLILKRKWRDALWIGSVMSIPVVIWAARNKLVHAGFAGQVYSDALNTTNATRIATNLWRYVTEFTPQYLFTAFDSPNLWNFLSQFGLSWSKVVVVIVTWLALILGCIKQSRNSFAYQVQIYLSLYLTAIILVPWPDGPRYLLPILPILFFFTLKLDVRSNLDIKDKIWYPHLYEQRDYSG